MTTLEIFEKVNLVMPIEQRRFFNFFEDTVSELVSTYGGDFVFENDIVLNYAHEENSETEWSFEKTIDIQNIKEIQMLADMENGAEVSIYALYDGEEFDASTSHLVYQSNVDGLKKAVTIYPKKTAGKITLHVVGLGYVKLYEIDVFAEYAAPKSITEEIVVKPLYHNAIVDNILFLAGGEDSRKSEFIRKSREAYLNYWNINAKGRRMQKARW